MTFINGVIAGRLFAPELDAMICRGLGRLQIDRDGSHVRELAARRDLLHRRWVSISEESSTSLLPNFNG